MSRIRHQLPANAASRAISVTCPRTPSALAIPPESARVIWRLSDGKPGHDKQSQGLTAALGRRVPVRVLDLAVSGRRVAAWHWLAGRFPLADALPDPWLILGAGHGTHLSLLAARRARGGRVVVLMQPSLPLAWFDLCLIPAHDDPPARSNVITTRGALNAIVAAGRHDPRRGLLLLGGPSAHFCWDDRRMLAQVLEVAAASPDVGWILTTSRRTPADFLARLAEATTPANLRVVPWDQTLSGWLEAELAACGPVWVSPDSVSMVYEALTSGCQVGLLDLEADPQSRVAQGVAGLAASGEATPLAAWRAGQPLASPASAFDEAGRCAELILSRWS